MALAIHADVGGVGVDAMPERAAVVDEHHPATVAYRLAGGAGQVWVKSTLPMGRGLGFSGAVRIGGALLGLCESSGLGVGDTLVRDRALEIAAELEGHADNVAASLYGGVVGTNGRLAARLPMGCELSVVVWIPEFTTSTAESRGKLPASVPFGDAVFNVSHTALLFAALGSGDLRALSGATADRLHQDVRFARAEPSRVALEAMREAGAIAAWLSGSGPTVACFARPNEAESIARQLPAGGQARVVAIDFEGARPADGPSAVV